ncbi:PAS domain-containing sensor histidine kinase [Roseibacillus persicicus]|uniref:sensor histidine kinase n=1 Tax=Roseibacillus persicicus TaxID=454148 RepID=UPI00398B7E21
MSALPSISTGNPSLFGIIRTDRDCRITEINPTLSDWAGFEADELVGKRFDALLDGAGGLYFDAHCLPSLEIGHQLEEIYLSLVTKSGEPLPVLINACRHGDTGQCWFEFGLVRMKRRARVEDELLRTKKLAVQGNEAKARFLGMITHELRNPLQSMTMSVDLLLEGSLGPLTPTQRELLESCQEAGSNLSHLINDILDFAGLQSGKVSIQIETISANDCLTRAESLLKPRIESSEISFETEYLSNDVKLNGDPRRIQQILLNLVTNAIKFTPPGGKITARLLATEQTISFEVEDTGCGIEESNLAKIFEAFVQVGKNETTTMGIGLGLAISRDLAHAMGGRIEVRSTPDLGSVFSLIFPQSIQ